MAYYENLTNTTTDLRINIQQSEDDILPKWFLFSYFTVRIIEGILALILNLLTIIVVLKFDQLKSPTNYFVCSLAAADGMAFPIAITHTLCYITANQVSSLDSLFQKFNKVQFFSRKY